jgi:hypothetical protein
MPYFQIEFWPRGNHETETCFDNLPILSIGNGLLQISEATNQIYVLFAKSLDGVEWCLSKIDQDIWADGCFQSFIEI